MNRRLGLVGAAALGLALTLAAPVSAGAAGAGVLYVPDDFVPALSDTRATGHHDVVATGLRIWTEGTTRSDKVAEYVATDTALAGIGEPSLEYRPTSGTTSPGFQLVVDLDDDGDVDGILVGETVYGNDWWLANGANDVPLAGAPSHTGGSGSVNHGTLDQWRLAFPGAVVTAFGFSLGSGVLGDGVLEAITFDGTRYTFGEHVVLSGAGACKDGGWATSTKPEFRNQGQCVSSFVSQKKK